MNRKTAERRGFTLAELLIVIAIIAVLIAVGIPVLSTSMKGTQAAVCAANRRALKAELSAELMLGELTESDINSVRLSSAGHYNYKGVSYSCPNGGEIYAAFTAGAVNVRCTYHDDGRSGTGASPVWTNASADGVWAVLKNTNAYKKYSGSVDSQSVNGKLRNEIVQAMSAANIDLSAMKATDWRFDRDSFGGIFQWTTADLSTLKAGDPIPVIRYRLDGTYSGAYSVWKGVVGETNGVKTVIALGGSGDEYTGGLTQEQKKDINNVLQYYNDNAGSFEKLD